MFIYIHILNHIYPVYIVIHEYTDPAYIVMLMNIQTPCIHSHVHEYTDTLYTYLFSKYTDTMYT